MSRRREQGARGITIPGTMRKLVFSAMFHQARHWAQAARIVRENGLEPPGGSDLVLSDALD